MLPDQHTIVMCLITGVFDEALTVAVQFAYAIASSQAPKGPLEYKLHGQLCPNAVTVKVCGLQPKVDEQSVGKLAVELAMCVMQASS